jgi:hypothetical protein
LTSVLQPCLLLMRVPGSGNPIKYLLHCFTALAIQARGRQSGLHFIH